MSQTIAFPATMMPAVSEETAKAKWHLPQRPLKLAAAGTLALAGLYGAFSEQIYVSSSDAVVSAYVLEVRAPIEGFVNGLPPAPGTTVHKGDQLGTMRNDLVDHQHLDELRTLENTALANAAADETELRALRQQRGLLLARASDHARAVSVRLQQSVAQAEATQSAQQATLAQAVQDLQRGRSLHEGGIIPNADFDRLLTAEQVSRQVLEAQRRQVASLRSQQTAAEHGLLTEPGANTDVTYSHQRADELSARIVEVERAVAASRAQAEEAHAAVEVESRRTAQLHDIGLPSPTNGQVWQMNAVDGERLTAGDAIVSVVDCGTQFLLAEVPQERMPQIAIGGTARIRLAGEAVERMGTVVSVSGDPRKETHRKFAAFPVGDTSQDQGTVRVAMQPGNAGECSVGRTARVVLPTTPSSFATRTVRRWF